MFKLRSFCRTCGIKLNKASSFKLFDKSNYQLIRLIEDIADMFLEFDNTMPDHICDGCEQKLYQMLAFRSKFLKVHQSFLATKKKHLQRKDISNKLGAASEKDKGAFVQCGDLQEEDMLEMIEEDPEDMEDSLPIADEGLCVEDQLEEDNQNQETYDEELTERREPGDGEQEQRDLGEDHEDPGEDSEELLEKEEDQSMAELSVSPKTAKKIIARKAKQARRSTQTWVCDQCGGVFKCSTYLKLHLLRHTGQKAFECDICQAKYYTENEMRRHRILHTDARPYACRYCGKTFRGCSSKVVHERTHTNVRPFQCQYCEMAFTSTSSRQRHEILHTNNRKYHCETCQQWFVRSTHLTLHQKTKMHKKKVASASENV